MDAEEELNLNRAFISSFGLDDGSGVVDFPLPGLLPNQVVWLRNLDRLISMIPGSEGYRFLDVGAGSGIAMCYVLQNYRFDSVFGIEVNPILVEIARENFSRARVAGTVLNEDASQASIEESPHVLFMFNPFSDEIFTKFMNRNFERLKNTCSYLLIANDHLRKSASDYGELVERNSKYNLSSFAIGT